MSVSLTATAYGVRSRGTGFRNRLGSWRPCLLKNKKSLPTKVVLK